MFRRIIILVALLAVLFALAGCYTTITTKKLTSKQWRKTHRYQYFSKTKWGKAWNRYYWSPTSRPLFSKSKRTDAKKTGKIDNDHTERYKGEYREPPQHTCIDDCASSCIFNFFYTIFGSDESDDSADDDENQPEKPKRRRGM